MMTRRFAGLPAIVLALAAPLIADTANPETLRQAFERLYDDVPTEVCSEPMQRLLENFQMTHWGASSSGNLQEYRTPEAAAQRAARIKRLGFTAVITNGLQNRFNYLHRNEEIFAGQKLVADACHAQSLRVFDHLDFTIYWQSSYPVFFQHPDWAMRDLRDGAPGRWLCLSHPEYREFYARYLEQLTQAGMDGFMLDEISFHDRFTTYCGCDHCRVAFERDTGLNFPEHWDEQFISNRDHPLFRLWQDWQRKAITQFKAFLLARIKAINPDAVILAYSTAIYRPSVRDNDMQDDARVCFTGTEGTDTVYPAFASFYAQHRILSAFARKYGRPAWAHFAASSNEEFVFSAYLSTLSNSGAWLSSSNDQALAATFNWEHWREARAWGRVVGDIAIVPTSSSRDGNYTTSAIHSAEVAGWCQGFGVGGVTFNIELGLRATVKNLAPYRAIVLPYAPAMTPQLIDAVDQYVRGGGVAIVTGASGVRDHFGLPLGEAALARRMGLRSIEPADDMTYIREIFGGGKPRTITTSEDLPRQRIELSHVYRFDSVFEDSAVYEVLAHFEDDHGPAIVSIPRGAGRYIVVGFLAGQVVHQPRLYKSYRWDGYLDPATVAMMTALARHATGDRDRVRVEADGIITAAYETDRRLWVRMLNIAGVDMTPREAVGLPPVTMPPLGEIVVHLQTPVANEALLVSPEREPLTLPVIQTSDSRSRLSIPPETFDQYAFIRFEKQP